MRPRCHHGYGRGSRGGGLQLPHCRWPRRRDACVRRAAFAAHAAGDAPVAAAPSPVVAEAYVPTAGARNAFGGQPVGAHCSGPEGGRGAR
eukprot:72936-Chlamydomonas_euryale.AAC.2